MFRSAGVLLIFGLAVGLWLGFNPNAHQRMVESWDHAKSLYVQATSDSSVKVHNWFTGVDSWTRTNSQTNSKTDTQLTESPAWRQISAVFETFWSSLQRIWLDVKANLA